MVSVKAPHLRPLRQVFLDTQPSLGGKVNTFFKLLLSRHFDNS